MPMSHAQAVRAGKKAALTRKRNAKKNGKKSGTKKKLWIQASKKSGHVKKGALHKHLGVPMNKRLDRNLLQRIEKAKIGSTVSGHKVTHQLKKEVVWALNV